MGVFGECLKRDHELYFVGKAFFFHSSVEVVSAHLSGCSVVLVRRRRGEVHNEEVGDCVGWDVSQVESFYCSDRIDIMFGKEDR